MAKPFSIQSPEDIATEYGGNKRKIAQAMQLGVVDPTAGVLAGMFIDRMRAAQMQEQAPQATVAQQVMGGAPPVPPTAPAGGLGATSQAAPPMAPPQMGMPPEMGMAPPQEEVPMGMAEGGMVPPYAAGGGLSDVPVPDGMFDEPSNGGFGDGYAGGGLVAFADGGDVPSFAGGSTVRDPLSWLHAPVTSLYGVKRSTGAHQGQDFGVSKDTPIGVPAPGKVVKASTDDINGNFVVVEHPDGTRSSYSHLSAFNVEPGQVVDAGEVIGLSGNTGRVRGKDGGYHLHFGARDAKGNRINPTDFFNRIASQTASGMFPERADDTTAGRMMSREDIDEYIQKRFGRSEEDTAAEEKMRARLEEQASDEYYEKQRKADMWQTLAEIGFNMASSKSPYILQALGEAAAAALPGARADKKERKALKDRAIEGLMELGARNRKEAVELFKISNEVYRDGVSQQQFDKRFALETTKAADERDYRMGSLAVENYKALHPNPSDLETKVQWVMDQKLAADPVSALKYLKDNGMLGGAAPNMGIPGLTEGTTATTQGTGAGNNFSGMSLVGSRPAQ